MEKCSNRATLETILSSVDNDRKCAVEIARIVGRPDSSIRDVIDSSISRLILKQNASCKLVYELLKHCILDMGLGVKNPRGWIMTTLANMFATADFPPSIMEAVEAMKSTASKPRGPMGSTASSNVASWVKPVSNAPLDPSDFPALPGAKKLHPGAASYKHVAAAAAAGNPAAAAAEAPHGYASYGDELLTALDDLLHDDLYTPAKAALGVGATSSASPASASDFPPSPSMSSSSSSQFHAGSCPSAAAAPTPTSAAAGYTAAANGAAAALPAAIPAPTAATAQPSAAPAAMPMPGAPAATRAATVFDAARQECEALLAISDMTTLVYLYDMAKGYLSADGQQPGAAAAEYSVEAYNAGHTHAVLLRGTNPLLYQHERSRMLGIRSFFATATAPA